MGKSLFQNILKSSIEKYSDTFLFATLLTATMFLSTDWFMIHDFLPRNYTFILISIIWTICCLLSTSESEFSLDTVTIFVFLLLFYLIIRSLSFPIKIQVFYFVVAGLLYFLFRYKDISSHVFNSIIAITCIIQALYGLMQFCELIPATSPFLISGSFDNPAGFSVSMTMGFPFLLNMTITSKNRSLGIIACLIVIGVVILSQSRTGFFAFVVVGTIFVINRYRNGLCKYRKIVIGAVITLLASIFVILLFIKPESTFGRIFIWKVATGLCLNNPIIGKVGSFNSDYMEAQACYFQANQNNHYELLADVITHPFNEFLLLFIQFGALGIFFLLLLCLFLLKIREPINSPYMLGLIVIIIHACFSYPLRYTFTWVILVYCISQIAKSAPLLYGISLDFRIVYKFISIVFLIPICYFTFKDIQFERKWKKVYVLTTRSGGLSEKDLLQYESLKKSWNGNPYFLYNYASELNYIGMYENSLKVFEICEKYLNDYAVQMRIADNYYQLGLWHKAESRYLKALAMCPNRFLPLQGLLRTYDKLKKYSDANDIASTIINKGIKVPSYTVSQIKAEAEAFLKKREIQNSF